MLLGVNPVMLPGPQMLLGMTPLMLQSFIPPDAAGHQLL